MAAAVTAAAGSHDSGLRKDAAAAVVATGEGDGVLVVMGEMEVPGEPALDLVVLADGLNEPLAGDLVVVVQPAAAVDNVAFLNKQSHRHSVVSDACLLPHTVPCHAMLCYAMLCYASLNAAPHTF